LPRYSKDTISEVLAANDIVAVVAASLEMLPAGKGRFKALCPFHNEKTPSFHVSQDRQMFHCFGCGKGGDAIVFLREHEGLSFGEALQKLAERGGVQLPAPTKRDRADDHKRTRLLAFAKFARDFFTQTLEDPLTGGPGRRYLKTRELRPEIVQRFSLGYARDDWSALTDAARKNEFTEKTLEESGLVRRGDGGRLYDFFRNRLMFPIRDASGNVLAFGGRDLGDGAAKYINSPESPIYRKGRVLYGLHEARDAMRKEKSAMLVEGYFDLLRCFNEGIENVVATCGTALTADQAALLRRYVREVVVVFDGDAAGVRAALRGIAILVGSGLAVRAFVLPEGQDPDDFIKQAGADALRKRVEAAADFVTFYVRTNKERTETIEGRTEVAKDVFAILLGIDDRIRRDEYLKRTARELGLNEWSAQSEFEKFVRRRESRAPAVVGDQKAPAAVFSQDDADFVAVLLRKPQLLDQTKRALSGMQLAEGPVCRILHELSGGAGPDLFQRLDDDAGRLYAAAANNERDLDKAAESLVQKRVARLKKEALRAVDAKLKRDIQAAEQANDVTKVNTLMVEHLKVAQQIDSFSTV